MEVLEEVISDPVLVAKEAGLRYVNDSIPGYSRRRNGQGYDYYDQYGDRIESERTITRINKLIIPHVWDNVWISPYERGHLQATGIDGKKRKQYRYHKEWEKVRNLNKFSRMQTFGNVLPEIRKQVQADLTTRKLSREKVLATILTLLDEKLIRVGNREYALKNKTYGLTTLRDRHVKSLGGKIHLEFTGKKNIEKEVVVTDKRLASVILKCKELPGYHLFQYYGEDGQIYPVSSEDVNSYLRSISGEDFTAKDFRTWGGSSIAIRVLMECEPCEDEKRIKKNIVDAIRKVAGYLGNTPNVCRNYYIHPVILDKYTTQEIHTFVQQEKIYIRENAWLSKEELIFMELLQSI